MVKITIKGVTDVLKDIDKKKNSILAANKKRVMNTLVERLREATPVDTGRARDGWYSTENSIENDVPYIEHLNQGTSEQAPEYFIEKTLLRQPGIKPSGIIVKSK